MYRQFNIQQFYVLPTQCIYVFCVDLRTNSHYFHIQHLLTGLYNRDGECLLRGMGRIFKHLYNLTPHSQHQLPSLTWHNNIAQGRYEHNWLATVFRERR